MAAIRTLLNPAPEEDSDVASEQNENPQLMTPTTPTFPENFSPTSHSKKKQKLCKDAAIFTRGDIRGDCRYPPYEYEDETLAAHHERFEMYPMGDIAKFPRHIPYKCDKRTFMEKTGRESLEVFQYQFKVPGNDTTYTMLWDYNIGLVRTTALFKCCGYSKTTPAKTLHQNIGLRDICHSITGGALVAQGYWMPYEAAKAVAATFCWSIRYALTPVFGKDFPKMCLKPDAENFGDMRIDPKIIQQCTAQATIYLEMELEAHTSRTSSPTPGPMTPVTPTYSRQYRHNHNKTARDVSSSGYSSEASQEDDYSVSSTTPSPYRNAWTAANIPRSVPVRDPYQPIKEILNSYTFGQCKKPTMESPPVSPNSQRPEADKVCDGDQSGRPEHEIEAIDDIEGQDASGLASDEKAAYLLLSLRFQQPSPTLTVNTRKRRASALL